MVHRAKSSHIGGCLSAADIMAALYGRFLRVDPARPDWPERDRFIISKGHAAAVLYATLGESGFFPLAELDDYASNGNRFVAHVTRGAPGVEVSTGSLGHGLPIGSGMALGFRWEKLPCRSVVLLSDGDCNEGSTWEAALLAGHLGLENLLAIVDYNKIQSFGHTDEVACLDSLPDKWRAFRWGVREIDGHDHAALADALDAFPFEDGRPSCLVCNTVKGKGVSFMENRLLWHYRSPSDEQLDAALAELEADQ